MNNYNSKYKYNINDYVNTLYLNKVKSKIIDRKIIKDYRGKNNYFYRLEEEKGLLSYWVIQDNLECYKEQKN